MLPSQIPVEAVFDVAVEADGSVLSDTVGATAPAPLGFLSHESIPIQKHKKGEPNVIFLLELLLLDNMTCSSCHHPADSMTKVSHWHVVMEGL